ncbi:MAG: patatin-like phospholipase family protein [Candidatus Moranbacteria bacterium]|nr:patatin-like phospholipase family protein [Candidatus Moranbacteria bacterium]
MRGKDRKKLGVALGGGIMRGMAHIGVLEILEEKDIPVDILVGCSSGAIVAAAYACGRINELKKIVLNLDKKDRRRVLDFRLTGEGLIKGDKLKSFFGFLTAEKNFSDINHVKLAFVATDANTGKEVVIDRGNIAEALEITTALPGLAPLKRYQGKLLFDGGTAMLVPAKIAYELGADRVIGVDVSANRSILTRIVGDVRELMQKSRLKKVAKPVFWMQNKMLNLDEKKFLGKARELMKRIRLLDDFEKHRFNFIEAYLIGLRAISADYRRGLFKDEDCDVAIHPEVFHIKRVDVAHSAEMIKEGRRATADAIPLIKKIL